MIDLQAVDQMIRHGILPGYRAIFVEVIKITKVIKILVLG
jgi:hypothetical protein